tara:strand:- start:165 stop:1073 length:909 start_codon:yes stop_codon:yes gene_type:complete
MTVKHKLILFLPISLVIGVGLKLVLPRPNLNDSYRDYCWTKKTHSTKRFNVLAVGDSRIYRGVNPAFLLNENSDLNAVNLAYSSAGYTKEYLSFVSRRIKENGKRVVLCGITPYSFTPEALKNEHYHSFLDKNKNEVYKILLLSGYLKNFPRYSPAEVWGYFTDAPITHLYYHDFKENGWVKSFKLPFDSTAGLIPYRKNFIDNTCNNNAVEEYIGWVEEMSHNNVTVIGFRPPSTLGMEQLEDSLSGLNYSSFRERFEQNGGIWLEFPLNDYSSYDGSHLHYKSANKFTKNLAQKIERYLK